MTKEQKLYKAVLNPIKVTMVRKRHSLEHLLSVPSFPFKWCTKTLPGFPKMVTNGTTRTSEAEPPTPHHELPITV